MNTPHSNKAPHKRVLIIDDSSIDNFVNNKMIALNNFSEEVISFTRAKKALEYLKEIDKEKTHPHKMPSLIFLDLNMPVMDGFEFLKHYEYLSDEIKNNCKIIVLTSSINPNDFEQTKFSKSVLTFLNKPLMKNNFDLIELLITNGVREEVRINSKAI